MGNNLRHPCRDSNPEQKPCDGNVLSIELQGQIIVTMLLPFLVATHVPDESLFFCIKLRSMCQEKKPTLQIIISIIVIICVGKVKLILIKNHNHRYMV